MSSLFPRGAIALVEPTHGHRQFLDKATPRYALLKYHHANRLLDRGETADSYFPDETDVITTTTVVDNRNHPIPLEHNGHRRGEAEIVKQFRPDYHIPADRADYTTYTDDYRLEKVKECMHGTVTIHNHIEDSNLDTQLIPFIKTATPTERTVCYKIIDHLGLDHAALYCNPYFNSGDGVNIDELLTDIDDISAESRTHGFDDGLNLVLLNCLSPNVLSDAHSNVVAGSGLIVGADRGWRRSITPTKQSASTVESIYATDVEQPVADALAVDVDLNRYAQQSDSDTDLPAAESSIASASTDS